MSVWLLTEVSVCLLTEMGNELSLELSRVVTEMESAMAKHSPLTSQLAHDAEHSKEVMGEEVTKVRLSYLLLCC